MANKRTKKKSSSSKRGGGRTPPRKRDGKAALRGMLVGAAIFVLLAIALMMPIGGATPFSHLLQAVGLTGDDVSDPSVGPERAPNANSAPPQETVTDEEQEGLDDLIEKKKQ